MFSCHLLMVLGNRFRVFLLYTPILFYVSYLVSISLFFLRSLCFKCLHEIMQWYSGFAMHIGVKQ